MLVHVPIARDPAAQLLAQLRRRSRTRGRLFPSRRPTPTDLSERLPFMAPPRPPYEAARQATSDWSSTGVAGPRPFLLCRRVGLVEEALSGTKRRAAVSFVKRNAPGTADGAADVRIDFEGFHGRSDVGGNVAQGRGPVRGGGSTRRPRRRHVRRRSGQGETKNKAKEAKSCIRGAPVQTLGKMKDGDEEDGQEDDGIELGESAGAMLVCARGR